MQVIKTLILIGSVFAIAGAALFQLFVLLTNTFFNNNPKHIL